MDLVRTTLLAAAVWVAAGGAGAGAVSDCATSAPAAAAVSCESEARAAMAAATSGEAAPTGGPVPAVKPLEVPEHARFDAWTVLPYGKGLVAIIARGRNGAPYGTASVYCDSEFKTQGPVFLYRVGGAVPSPAEVDRLNRLLQGASLSVDGETIQTVTRSDLGHSFSGLQLLEDGTLSYMVLIDPSVLESILHGQQMKAVLNFPPEVEADPRYAEQTIPLKNSRKAMEEALKHCV